MQNVCVQERQRDAKTSSLKISRTEKAYEKQISKTTYVLTNSDHEMQLQFCWTLGSSLSQKQFGRAVSGKNGKIDETLLTQCLHQN